MPKDSLLGLKPKGMSMDMDDGMGEEEDEGTDDVKAEAGNELASAIKSGDGAAICRAVKAIVDLESYEE
jgi:hypothetical protein